MTQDSKKKYEVSFLSNSENGAATMVNYLKTAGAEIISEGELKKIKLAYPVGKDESAYFGCIVCSINPESVAKIHDAVRLDNNIKRLLVVSSLPSSEKTGARITPRGMRDTKRSSKDSSAPSKKSDKSVLSNELLEEKLEEILQ